MIQESPESASPTITRAVAAALARRPFEPVPTTRLERAALRLASALPGHSTGRLLSWFMGLTALRPSGASEVKVKELAAARLADYADLSGPFNCVVAGAAVGGAAAHLAAVLGAPFLPQPFILGFRGGAPEDELGPHLRQTQELGRILLDNNPGVHVLGHFDPLHDGWITRRLTHIRLKLIQVPDSYRSFILEKLRPGGTIVYLDCGASWLQHRLGPKFTYQIGGWGDIPPREFLRGSERINAYLRSVGSKHRGGWSAGGMPLEERPESEWGSEPGLGGELEAFARENGFGYLPIRLASPHAFSCLAFRAHEALYRKANVAPQGILVETFGQYDPGSALRGALLPLWLVFNTRDSLEFLERSREGFPEGLPVLFSGLVTFSWSPDSVPWEDWVAALEGLVWASIGARPRRYPEDAPALWQGPKRLRDWVLARPVEMGTRLAPEELAALVGP